MRSPVAVIASVLESVIDEPATWSHAAVRDRLVKGATAYMRGVGMRVESVEARYNVATGELTLAARDGDFEAEVMIRPRKR